MTSLRHSGDRRPTLDVGVARVVGLAELVVDRLRRRRDVERAAPGHEHLLAILLKGLLLVLALQRAVVALVQAPRTLHRDPVAVGGVQGQVGGGDGPTLHRGVHDVGEQAGLLELLATSDGLGPALVSQVDVDPAGEQVLGVPLALAVTKENEGERFG